MAKKRYEMIALSPIHPDKTEADGGRDSRGLILPGVPFAVFTAKKRDALLSAGLAKLASVNNAAGTEEPEHPTNTSED